MAKHPTGGRRTELCAWLTANNIDPNNVLADSDITIVDTPEGRAVRLEMAVRTADGHLQADERGEGVATEIRTVPLVVEPPGWWTPYEKPTREQLLAVVEKVRALHHGPRTERHGSGCVQCGIVWPCPTARAVADPKES